MRVFKTKWFARYARKERIADALLREAITRAEDGLVDADLGGGLIKQRVGRPSRGRSGGYRSLIAFRRKDRAIFVFAFAKSEMDNVEDDYLRGLKGLGQGWLSANELRLEMALADGSLVELEK